MDSPDYNLVNAPERANHGVWRPVGSCMRLGCCVLTLGFMLGPAAAQTTSTAPKAASAAEEDISGMYSFERDGEFIQITVEPAEPMKAPAVSGFISRYGDDDSDRGVFLDHFISKGSLDKQNLN